MEGRIIVYNYGDLDSYLSPAEACLDLEAIDVRNDEYVAYDENGNVFAFEVETTEPEGRFWFKRPREKIVIKPLGRNDRDELARIITSYLEGVGVLSAGQKSDLGELVDSLFAFQNR